MLEQSKCPNCAEILYNLTEFCPHCKVRLHYSVRRSDAYAPAPDMAPSAVAEVPPRANLAELEYAANLCSRLSGASLMWPLVALFMALMQGHSVDSVVNMLLGLMPAAAGAACFAIASVYFRSEKKNKGGSSDMVSAVVFALCGFGVWVYAWKFFMAFKY
jgi:hypothetical protein